MLKFSCGAQKKTKVILALEVHLKTLDVRFEKDEINITVPLCSDKKNIA
jgi:hypothetical protein